MSVKLVGCQDTSWKALYTKTSINPSERTPSNASLTLLESEQSIRIANTCAISPPHYFVRKPRQSPYKA